MIQTYHALRYLFILFDKFTLVGASSRYLALNGFNTELTLFIINHQVMASCDVSPVDAMDGPLCSNTVVL